ncbi:GntR family transcriptional regulator [Aliiroseovarius sp. 2305UL8-7]|uniref:GntR family transcriptional regulator n=1 Tax=Aliiroseovarius conchicola TaxID=3121637 RepID=UPI003526EBE9
MGWNQGVDTQLSDLISSGILRKGTKLPSCRMLANDLGVSVNSVLGAYSRLTVSVVS